MIDRRGFTLMELLVVLLIIGVLSTVAIRTIDATRNRVLFDETTAEMKDLIEAVVGDEDLMAEGRRVDFGFYGDMGRLPEDLQELVENTTSSPNWRGPYFRRELAGDSLGHLYDAWGNRYTYDANTGVITTVGDGKFPMTMRVADTLTHLDANTISGSVSDADGNPPGGTGVNVFLREANDSLRIASTDEGGHYEFDSVRIGLHRVTAVYGSFDSVVHWAAVSPRTRNVIDFRFSRPFRNLIKTVDQPILLPDSSGFIIRLVNDHVEDITLSSAHFKVAPDSAYFRELKIEGQTYQVYTTGIGLGDTASFTGYPIPANRSAVIDFGFYNFYVTPTGPPDPLASIESETFRLRFNDGSEITIELPEEP